MIGLCIVGALLAFLLIIVIRAICFTPKPVDAPDTEPFPIDEDAAAKRLQAMIRCRTESFADSEKENKAEFNRFITQLSALYPILDERTTREEIGDKGLMYRWKGQSQENPTVLMAHYDVVPADDSQWSQSPFAANVVDGVMYGRGTLDTKGTMHGILEAAQALLQKGFTPKNDVYLCFAGDEEVMGHGARDIVGVLDSRGIRPQMVLDEGGAVVNGAFPGVKQPCAVVGVAEKGSINIDLTAKAKGGHSSAPAPHTALGLLGRAMARVEQKPMPARFPKPAMELFDTLGRHSGFGLRLVFANLWCFRPLLDLICKKSGGEMNALVRTTCAFTRAKGSEAYNILEQEATVGCNARIICGETADEVLQRLQKTIGDDHITLKLVGGDDPSEVSKTFDETWDRLRSAILKSFPDAIVSPYLMLACSDSRHYQRICQHVYRFSGMALSKEERGLIHNANERMPLSAIPKTIEFFANVLKTC